MRKLILAAMAIVAIGATGTATTPAARAQDYAYCLQGRDEGIPGDCSYSTYAQCQASASGRNASCNTNPRAAFAQQHTRERGHRRGAY